MYAVVDVGLLLLLLLGAIVLGLLLCEALLVDALGAVLVELLVLLADLVLALLGFVAAAAGTRRRALSAEACNSGLAAV